MGDFFPHTLIRQSYNIAISIFMLMKAIFLPSEALTIICSILIFFLIAWSVFQAKKRVDNPKVLIFFNTVIAIIMIEILLGFSIQETSQKTFLAVLLISQTFSIDYKCKRRYQKIIPLLFYVYLGFRFWETSTDHIIELCLLIFLAFFKIWPLTSIVKNISTNEQTKAQLANYFLDFNPTFTVIVQEKKKKTSQDLFTDCPFDLVFANECASKDYGIKDANSLVKVLDNIQLNSNDILNVDQSPNYSPNLKTKKFGLFSSYLFDLMKNRLKFLPKYQKFLVTYNKATTSSNEQLMPTSSVKQYRVILIIFAIDGKLSIFMNMEDSNIEDQLKKLKEMDLYKDQMLASITHDLKSPLSSVLTLIGNAKSIDDNEERGKNLDYAIVNGNLLLNLINDILDYSLMKRGKFSLFFTHFSLTQILDDVIKLMKIQADLKGIELRVDNQCTLDKNPNFFSDFRRIKQVLINLIGNALKFTSNGRIIVKVANIDVPNIIKFEVIDSGMGIKEEIIKHLGKPFNSFERQVNFEGVGLGLHICKTIIGQLGPFEKMHISSHVGSGSKFGFLIYLICEKKSQKFQTADQLDDLKKNQPFLFGEVRKRSFLKMDDEFSVFYSKECCTSDFDEKKNQIETCNYSFNKNNDIKTNNSSARLLTLNNELKTVNKTEPITEINMELLISPKNSPKIKKSTFFKKPELVHLSNLTHETSLSRLILKKPAKVFRILLVDDDPFQHFIYKGLIKKMKDNVLNMVIEFHEASNGIKALELFKLNNVLDSSTPYNVIFLDCHMPIQNGYQTAALIKKAIKEEGFIDCRIVGCSALHGNNEELNCFETGMDFFLPKPLNFENFQEIMLTHMKMHLK